MRRKTGDLPSNLANGQTVEIALYFFQLGWPRRGLPPPCLAPCHPLSGTRPRRVIARLPRWRPGAGAADRGKRFLWRTLLWSARSGAMNAKARSSIGFLEREALARDLGLVERRLHAAELGHQRDARTLVERPAVLAGVLLETLDSAENERVVVGHLLFAQIGRAHV